jgi:hypothetical protein
MLQPTVEIGSTKKIIVPVAFTLSMPAFEIIVYKICTTLIFGNTRLGGHRNTSLSPIVKPEDKVIYRRGTNKPQ